MTQDIASPPPIVLVTGPSGAGRSTATRALEDFGFEAIDNMPLSLVPRLLDGRPAAGPLALGLDTRNRDFGVPELLDVLARLRGDGTYSAKLLYLDCRPDQLVRRFSETRRRHPFAPEMPIATAVEEERALLRPIAEQADVLIDTSDLSPHELRAALTRFFALEDGPGLQITVTSFSFKRGLPQDLDTVFDVRFLANPHWDEALRPLDGRDPKVAGFVEADPNFAAFFARVTDLILSLLPAYITEGKTSFTIGFGCTGGRHRSVAVAEKLAKTLAEAGWRVSIQHREQDRGRS
ncbi:RNase adapter RapZ [Ovoidimarina sediminis]|uniref:RNase adapter RapZ n=1 Tax=Ovoidimarina sediminis TaxID=3079856 RepID=UPI002908832C|nr:RNase adapter RapZ [Rhodophyticola sp. MJ-SS7]MDU8946005.1 RNase adapter RapZ [Rhodophyticola sp. MJ-SS7]